MLCWVDLIGSPIEQYRYLVWHESALRSWPPLRLEAERGSDYSNKLPSLHNGSHIVAQWLLAREVVEIREEFDRHCGRSGMNNSVGGRSRSVGPVPDATEEKRLPNSP